MKGDNMAVKAKKGTLEWIREKKAEQSKRQAELDAAYEENKKKMQSASAKMSAAIVGGRKEEYYEAEKEFKDADFAIKHYNLNPEIPLEVSEEEVSQIAAAIVQDHNQIMEAKEGKYKEALEGLRDALREIAKQQNAFLKLCKEFGSIGGWPKEEKKAKLINHASGYDPIIVFLYKKCGLISLKEAIELESILNDQNIIGPEGSVTYSMVSNPWAYIDGNKYADRKVNFVEHHQKPKPTTPRR